MSRESARIANALAASPRRRSNRISAGAAVADTDVSVKDEILTDEGRVNSPVSLKRKRAVDTPLSNTLSTFEYEHKVTSSAVSPSLSQTPTKKRRSPAKRVKKEDGKIEIAPPSNWQQVYSLTKKMRSPGGKAYPAVVDSMGCEALADRETPPEVQRFQTLISLMLSSQTKDTVTAAAIKRLQNELPGGLTLESILAVDPVTLDEKIGKVGFHNTKTKHIKASAEILRVKHGGDIPDTIEGLVSLPGVGPKMAYLTMSAAWGRDEGIGVDVHVHRITNLWGWHKTKNPEETRAMLEGWLPREFWHEINWLLVGFGQELCKPVGRKCGDCALAEEGLCPSSVIRRQTIEKRKREALVVEGNVVMKSEVKIEETEVTRGELEDIEDAGRRVSPR